MKTTQLALLPIAITFALTGCGGSDGDSNKSGEAPTYEVAATLSSANVGMPFTVCADFDRDWSCGSGEPSIQSEQQTFMLKSADIKIKISPLLVKAPLTGNGTRSATANVVLATPAVGESSSNLINGVTTLVVGEMLLGSSKEQAVAKVAANIKALGITPSADLLTASDDPAVAEFEQQVVNVLGQMAKRSESYDRLVAGTAKGVAIYGQEILDGSLTESQLDELATLGMIASQAMNDTGLVKHFNLATGQLTDEPDSGAPGQDASYGLDVTDGGFKFTKLDAKGQPLAADSETWQCVKDDRTGLVWEHKADDKSSYRDKHRMFAYETATLKPHQEDLKIASCTTDGVEVCTTLEYANELNGEGYCGKTNWRVPTMNEQYDLLDFGETAKDAAGNIYGLSVKFFNDLVIGEGELPYGIYWASTLLRTDPGYTSGKHLTHLTQMTNVEESSAMGEMTAYYGLCEAGQSEECISPNALTLRMVAE
ncbi:DUF1566 domain-containing protein [Photobacterium sp. SDRW27]|uniref:Lcl domain-containing protein n=1 Tax=Photobacterium obscurum TaxID=2829490 RepID=UPI0022436638|nr:DUF1566 domain-containing protein [Photobacterium obscurum]MCW8332168.1 DUF1566 domain-containing protein [Photobacterium obscurum]